MTDPRVSPDPSLVVSNTPAQISVPVADLCRAPHGARDRQLLFGDSVHILNRQDRTSLVRATKDGYCGYVANEALSEETTPTHRVTARASHFYEAPDMKSKDLGWLSFGSRLTAVSETATFIETPQGHVPRQHVHGLDATGKDPASIAEIFLGTPYLWGGNSHLGIDCSGLVQAACLACAIPCPGDSDQQASLLGAELQSTDRLCRNDLIFWQGHVALVCDADTLIHANAGHMAVVFEPVNEALTRIEAQGDGAPTGFRRLPVNRD